MRGSAPHATLTSTRESGETESEAFASPAKMGPAASRRPRSALTVWPAPPGRQGSPAPWQIPGRCPVPGRPLPFLGAQSGRRAISSRLPSSREACVAPAAVPGWKGAARAAWEQGDPEGLRHASPQGSRYGSWGRGVPGWCAQYRDGGAVPHRERERVRGVLQFSPSQGAEPGTRREHRCRGRRCSLHVGLQMPVWSGHQESHQDTRPSTGWRQEQLGGGLRFLSFLHEMLLGFMQHSGQMEFLSVTTAEVPWLVIRYEVRERTWIFLH